MDMYKKRELRKKKKENDYNKSNAPTSINWLMETYGNTHSNLYKIRILTN